MEQCPKCGSTLRVGRTYYSYKNDDTPKHQTELYTNMEMICTNKTFQETKDGVTSNVPCKLYVGKDIANPEHIVKHIQHKVQ